MYTSAQFQSLLKRHPRLTKMDHNKYFRLVRRQVCGYDLWLQPIPGNGSCLFGSIVHQVLGIHPDDEVFASTTLHVRALIVDHLRKNFARYFDYLIPFAEDFVEHGFVDEYDRVWQYLDLLADNRFWGGEECLSVACELYNISITVWDERIDRFREYSNGAPVARKVSIFYTGSHYDSVTFLSSCDNKKPSGSVDIPMTQHVLKVKPFYGQTAVYQSVLHQLGISQDDAIVATLCTAVVRRESRADFGK